MNITITITEANTGGYFVEVREGKKGYLHVCKNKRELAKYLSIRAYKPIP
jgi:hypothetical protein